MAILCELIWPLEYILVLSCAANVFLPSTLFVLCCSLLLTEFKSYMILERHLADVYFQGDTIEATKNWVGGEESLFADVWLFIDA